MNTVQEQVVGRKKSPEEKPRRYGTQIRVSNAFADLVVKAANTESLSVAEYVDKHLMAIVEKRYRDAILREAKRLGGGE